MGYYLMVKEAIGLNIKYLCKCKDYKDPNTYKGSGVYWRRIIKKHNPDIQTTVLGHYETNEELRKAGEYYSDKFDIVHNKHWANLIEEIGDGGPTVKGRVRAFNTETNEQRFFDDEKQIPVGWKRGSPSWSKNNIAIEKTRQAHLGRKRSEQTKQKMKNAWSSGKRKPFSKKECEYCGKEIVPMNIDRHEERCKLTHVKN